MGLIAGKPLPQSDAAKNYVPRVIVLFGLDFVPKRGKDIVDLFPDRDAAAWKALRGKNPKLEIVPLFDGSEGKALDRLLERAGRSKAASRLQRYGAIRVPEGIEAAEFAAALAKFESIEKAYVEPGPTPPPVNPGDDPRSANQGYLDAAPIGIDARWAWGSDDGSGVGFVDLEQGWTLDHEDLAAAGITLISGVNQAYPDHGTAVLGEVVGVDNTLGIVGIAPKAAARVVSQWRTSSTYGTAEAIVDAAASMVSGDVLLLEAQTTHPNAVPTDSGRTAYVPVEVYDAVFDAIRAASDAGIVVVEAGANGSVDLDAFKDSSNEFILNRDSSDFRDSGAILVGAASSASPHTRLRFSNFGSRIDCYGWGENIDTCGYGSGPATTAYTTTFGGTSGASPIVTGAALILQSMRVRLGQPRFTPNALRNLLSDPTINTPSAAPATDLIGVMPNLRTIYQKVSIGSVINSDRWRLIVQILFGVIQDGGGVIIVPGKGPVPIDPWGPKVGHLSVEKRDILVGLAIGELAELVEDREVRREFGRSTIGVLKRSVERLAARLN